MLRSVVSLIALLCLVACDAGRTKASSLEASRYSAPYQNRLDQGYEEFVEFCNTRANGHRWQHDPSVCDQLLVDFIEKYYTAGGSMWLPKHAVLAVQKRFPLLRDSLERCWTALWSWKLKVGSRSRVPMGELPMHALFLVCRNQSFIEPLNAMFWFPCAVLFRVAFHGLLRPIEIISLRCQDVLFHRDNNIAIAVLRISCPKKTLTMGLCQFTVIRDSATVAWLQWLCLNCKPALKLWPSGRAKLVTFFKRACALVTGSVHTIWTLASFRAGGATHLILCGTEVARIKFQGRWRSEGSLASYIQEAVGMLVLHQLPAGRLAHIESNVDLGATYLSSPPSTPWVNFFSRHRQWRSLVTHRPHRSKWQQHRP